MPHKQAWPAFTGYAAQKRSYALLSEQFVNGRPVHSYLISGAKGVGKKTFARVLAASLYCQSDAKPCGACDMCLRTFSGRNPDVIEILAEDKAIPVDRVREVIDTAGRYSFLSGFRVVMIEPAEKMTNQAQNCLLKTLEEPAPHVVFMLLSREISLLAPTVVSRCCHISLSPWEDELLHKTLLRMGFNKADIDAALPQAGGNIGRALEMLTAGGQDAGLSDFVKRALTLRGDADVVSLSTLLKDDRAGATRYLDALERAVYQAVLAKTGRMPEDISASCAGELASAPLSSLISIMRAIFSARRVSAGQVNWQSNIDHLLMRILEETAKWHQ